MPTISACNIHQLHLHVAKPQNGVQQQQTTKGLGYWTKEISYKSSDLKNVMFKPIYHFVDWMKMYNPGVSQRFINLGAASKDTKNAIAFGEVPGKVYAFACSFWNLVKAVTSSTTEKVGGLFKKAFLDAAAVANPVCDSIYFLASRSVLSLTPEVLKRVMGFNALGLGVVSVNGLYEANNTITSAQKAIEKMSGVRGTRKQVAFERDKITHAQIEQGKWGSYVMLAGTSLASWAGLITAAPWVFLAFSTSATFFTVTGFFHGKANDLK